MIKLKDNNNEFNISQLSNDIDKNNIQYIANHSIENISDNILIFPNSFDEYNI